MELEAYRSVHKQPFSSVDTALDLAHQSTRSPAVACDCWIFSEETACEYRAMLEHAAERVNVRQQVSPHAICPYACEV